MRKIILIAAVLLISLPVLAAESGMMATESGWFDMENCAMCKNLTEDPGLLPNTHWENFKIDGGMMNITTVDPAYRKAAGKAMAQMNDLGQKMSSGEINPMSVKLCGHCTEFGMLMMAGAEMETVNGKEAEVSLMTSDDPAMVKRIHAMVDRDNKEMALMMGGGDHSGHDHGKDQGEHPHKH